MTAPHLPDDDEFGPGEVRAYIRTTTAIIGFGLIVAILLWTWIDRVSGDGRDPVVTATLNAGLYAERASMIVAVMGLMLAVYIGTRAGE